MGSISTMRGDHGETSLVGGIRVSKSSLRVEAYGTVDELGATLGFARSICDDPEMGESVRQIQIDLFRLGSRLATPPESAKVEVTVERDWVDRLTEQVHRLEALDGVLGDWSLPGSSSAAAAFDVARTVCRRAERCLVRLGESGESVPEDALPYLNRLSDLLWLFGRKIERDLGVDGSLRATTGKAGKRWSRAW
jgi:cob(I)alamin adenosyltransferase